MYGSRHLDQKKETLATTQTEDGWYLRAKYKLKRKAIMQAKIYNTHTRFGGLHEN